jgi:hypothetical protein
MRMLILLCFLLHDLAHVTRGEEAANAGTTAVKEACNHAAWIADAAYDPYAISRIGVVFKDTITAIEPGFYNGYPVYYTERTAIKTIASKLYINPLTGTPVEHLLIDAVTRSDRNKGQTQKKYEFYLTSSPYPQVKLIVTLDAQFNTNEPAANLTSFMVGIPGVGAIEAAEPDILIANMTAGGQKMFKKDGDKWINYDYGEGEITPTGLIYLAETNNDINYLVMFQTVYGLYTYKKPINEAIKLSSSQRHFDNKRLIGCPTNPCHDFKVDAAVVSYKRKRLILMSGLHGYSFSLPSGRDLTDKDMNISTLMFTKIPKEVYKLTDEKSVLSPEKMRVDAAFVAYNEDQSQEVIFLFVLKILYTSRINGTNARAVRDGSDTGKSVGDVFSGIDQADAAVSFFHNKVNHVWIFYTVLDKGWVLVQRLCTRSLIIHLYVFPSLVSSGGIWSFTTSTTRSRVL